MKEAGSASTEWNTRQWLYVMSSKRADSLLARWVKHKKSDWIAERAIQVFTSFPRAP